LQGRSTHARQTCADLIPFRPIMLSAGSRLGAYEIGNLLGAGGMGEVYRARDTRLGREVAIKVLPADRLIDDHHRRRFVQEAQSASALNHPHIVTIYEIESAGDFDFIVMEYVRGRSLESLIPRAGMRLSELLRIAIPIADALGTAHARGIVHRDLKPANVIVGDDGTVKVVDFGLAKLIANEVSAEDQTVTQLGNPDLSAPGTVAGTAAYMAPEQATGGRIDARSDIFSFGAMLYEMATGARPFSGASTADTLAAVIRAQPKPPAQIVSALPRELERLILRCLRKEPERRYQTMVDVKIELQEIKEESDSASLAAPVSASSRWSHGRLAAAAGAVVVIVAAAAWIVSSRAAGGRLPGAAQQAGRGGSPGPMTAVPLTAFPGQEVAPTFSPDGSQIAFAWSPEGPTDRFDLYVKVIGSEKPLRLTQHPTDFIFPAWSPDGRQIAFARMAQDGDAIYLMSPLGGPERKLADADFDYFLDTVLSWSPDGKLLAFSGRNASGRMGITVIDVATQEKRWQGAPSSDCTASWVPSFSPDGASLAFGCMVTYGVNELFIAPASGGTARQIGRVQGDWTGMTWTPDARHLIFTVDGDVWRIAAAGGEPEKLLAGRDAALPAVSRTHNRLAYTIQTSYNVSIWEVRMDRPIRAATPPTKLLSSSRTDMRPAFSPDGSRLTFESTRSGSSEIWISDADGSNAAALTTFGGPWTGAPKWSPDGQFIAFDSRLEGHSNVYVIPSQGGPPRRVTRGDNDGSLPEWSADGEWLYFNAKAGDVEQIFRIPVAGGVATQLTTKGGTRPVVSRADPTRIYYESPTGMVCSISTRGADERCLSAFPRLQPEFWDAWTLGGTGIYFMNAASPSPGVDFFEFRSGRVTRVADVPGRPVPWAATPALSPDGRRLVYAQLDGIASDIMLVDDFR
jgi:Tol biopolymer transport system component/predicted Ser/Thr protein kinase